MKKRSIKHDNILRKRRTKEDFIEESKKLHGDKFDYELVEYKNLMTKVKIKCKNNHIFEQPPKSHLYGDGCPICSNRSGLSLEEFINRSRKIHGEKYDYSLVEYKNVSTKVKIICPEHGSFEQVADSHMRGIQCKKCGIKDRKEKRKLKLTDFIERSNIIHHNKYNYNLVEYENYITKVKIICPEHGPFEQVPSSHLNCVGCPDCSKSYGGTLKKRFLYLFYDKTYNLMKIGLSNNPKRRIKVISGNNLILLKYYKNCGHLEFHLHKKYAQFRTEHTIYKDGKTEWFNLNENEIPNIEKFIKSYREDNSDHNQQV